MSQTNISLENVIAALEACSFIHNPDCSKCYLDGPGFGFACRDQLMRNALVLLKEQEPRVMTLEEFQETGYNPKWLEFKDGKLGKWTLGYAGLDIFFDDQMPGYLSVKLYGKTWRCWTSYPTDEQREAVPWE